MSFARSRQADSVPIVDTAGLRAGEAGQRAVGKELRRVYEQIGFAYIGNHGVAPELIDGVFTASRAFHALPVAAKMKLKMGATHRGYMPLSSSTLVTSSVARVTKPNQSESFMMLHDLPADDPQVLAGMPLQGVNQWPEELPGFRAPVLAYNAALEDLARVMTRAIALAFDLPADWFAPYFKRPTTWLRLLHYPPAPPTRAEDEFGSAPHTDYGFITILAQDDSGGLQVRAKDGAWIDAPPIPGTFVVNVADILMRWTNGHLQSTPHRVINRSGRDRYSVPFFYDPDMSATVECLPSLIAQGERPRFTPVNWGAYVMERLDKNYDYRKSATREENAHA